MADPKEKMTGTIIRVFLNKGFGFVRGADGISRFTHASDFVNRRAFDTLREGQGVLFVSADFSGTDRAGGNQLRATQVEVL